MNALSKADGSEEVFPIRSRQIRCFVKVRSSCHLRWVGNGLSGMAGSPPDRRTVVGVGRPVSIIHTKHHHTMSTRKAIFPENPHALYREHGYSPAIQSGDLLFVSGMVGAREDGTPEPDPQAQVQLAFTNLQSVLEASACNSDDVVDVTIYMTNPETTVGFALEELKRFFREPAPNITAVGVNWLAGFQFEIKVTARVPQR